MERMIRFCRSSRAVSRSSSCSRLRRLTLRQRSRRNASHPTTRKRPWETRRPFGRESRAFFVSGWRCRDRPKANLRKFRGYSSDCQNQKYEAISEGFVAGGHGFEPRSTESESPRRVLVCHASSPAPCSCANTRASGPPSLSFQPDICGPKQPTQASSSLVRQY
jgi:hypothetical protein